MTQAQQHSGCSCKGQGKAVGRKGQGDMAHVVMRGHHASLQLVVGPSRSSRERVAMSINEEGRSAVTGLQKRKLARKKKKEKNTHPTQHLVVFPEVAVRNGGWQRMRKNKRRCDSEVTVKKMLLKRLKKRLKCGQKH